MPLHAPLGVAFLVSLRAIYFKLVGEPASGGHRFMNIIRVLGVLIGISLVTLIIREVGWDEVKHSLGMMGWGYILVIIYPFTWNFMNTLGWRMALHKQFANQPILRMMQIRLSGEAFNSLLPSGYIGGEPLKAKLLSQWIPMREAVSSVLIGKAAQSIGLAFFVGLGLTMGARRGQVAMHPKTLIALLGLSIGIFIFTMLLTKRSFSRAGAWLHRMTGHPWLKKQEEKLNALDDSIGAFYQECKPRFLGSLLWHCAGWIAGALEVSIIFTLIGHSVSWKEAWFIGAMAQLAAVIGLFAPAGIGLYEGGHYLAAAALGLPPALGVSVALIRRVREIVWNCGGLWIFWRLSKNKTETTQL